MTQKTLSKELLELLACPVCKTALKQDTAKNTLLCVKCKAVYPVENGIPILLPKSK